MNKQFKATLPGKIIFSEAVLIAVIFHLALLFLFTSVPESKSTKEKRTQRFVMLNFSREQDPDFAQLTRWLEYHDPTLIARPNSRYGYDSLSRRPELLRYQPDSKWQEPPAAQTAGGKFVPLITEPTPKINSYARMIDYQPVPLPKIKKIGNVVAIPTSEKFPIAVAAGNLLKNFFPGGVPPTLQDLSRAAEPSRLDVKFTDEVMPRISVENSSGHRKLDNAAIKEVIANLDQLKTFATPGEPLRVIVIWRKQEVQP